MDDFHLEPRYVLMVYWKSLNAVTFVGEAGVVQRLKMDIRHDEETDVFQGAWWQAISTPRSTSAIDVCRLQIWQDIIRNSIDLQEK